MPGLVGQKDAGMEGAALQYMMHQICACGKRPREDKPSANEGFYRPVPHSVRGGHPPALALAQSGRGLCVLGFISLLALVPPPRPRSVAKDDRG